MIALLCLIVLAASQQCPYCEWNACAISSQGLANCSACSQGALVQLVAGASNVSAYGYGYQQTIGVCMLCMTGCGACTYGGFSPAMSPLIVGIYCTSCNPGYTYNYAYGNCSICPANCQVCTCEGDTCWSVSCTTCSSGYTLSAGGCLLDTTAALAGGPEQSSTNVVTVGLATWGVMMTLIAAVFIGLWAKNRNKVSSLGMLNVELAVARNSN